MTRPPGLHPHSLKWTLHGGALPLWIADMDLPVAEHLRAALRERLEHSLGYPSATPLQALLAERLGSESLPGLTPEGVLLMPGVVPGLYAAVAALTEPGDAVLCVLPTYPMFHLACSQQGRELRGVPLQPGEPLRREALEAAWSPEVRLLMLCHPHNPLGRVWDKGELAALRDFALDHDLWVVSDELHAPLCFGDAPAFEPFAADGRVRERTLTLTGPNKAFNTAGVGIGAAVSHGAELHARLQTRALGYLGHPSALGLTLWEAILTEREASAAWLAQTMRTLEENRDAVTAWARSHGLAHTPPQATYLAWLDFGDRVPAGRTAGEWLLEAGVALSDGPTFAPPEQAGPYRTCVRLNFALPAELLGEGLARMERALG